MAPISWWQVGSDVFAMSEYKDGHKVDPHNLQWISGSNYGPGLETAPSFPECQNCNIRTSLNPAHETYDTNLGQMCSEKRKIITILNTLIFYPVSSSELTNIIFWNCLATLDSIEMSVL